MLPNYNYRRSSLVTVNHDLIINEDQEISRNVGLRFTDSRGPTQLGNLQGDHVTAYSLYIECAITIVKKYILENPQHEGISSLLKDMRHISRQDESLLKNFIVELDAESFKGSQSLYDELPGRFFTIRKGFDDRAKALSVNIMAINQLKALIVSDPIEQKYIQEIHRLNAECLKKEIIEIRGEYFFIIAQEVAEKYLLFQNKAPFVAFRKVPGQNADSGEGGRIAGALSALRKNDSLTDVSATFIEPGPQRYPRRHRNLTSLAETSKILEIVTHINTLLFYPKIISTPNASNEQELEQEDLSRTNKKNIFCYVIARHLLIVFAAFKNLTKNQGEKEKVMKEFISHKCKEWKFSEKDKNDIEHGIMLALTMAQALPYEIDGEEDQMNVSMGMDGIAELRTSPIISPHKKKIGQAPE